MNRTTCISILLLLGLGLLSPCLAQEMAETEEMEEQQRNELFFGITGSATIDIHQGEGGNLRIWDQISCPTISTVTGRGDIFGIIGRYRFSSLLTLRSTLAFHSHYSHGKESFASTKVILPNPDDQTNQITANQMMTLEAKGKYSYISVGLAMGFDLLDLGPGSLQALAGVEWGFHTRFQTEVVQTNVAMPADQSAVSSSSNLNSRIVESINHHFHIERSRISLQGGILYNYPLSDAVYIEPGLLFDYSLTRIMTDSGWKMHSLIGQIGIAIQI